MPTFLLEPSAGAALSHFREGGIGVTRPHMLLALPFTWFVPVRVRVWVRLTFYRAVHRLAGRPGARLLANAHEAFIALLSAIVALQFFAAPGNLDRSPVGQAIPPWDYIWNTGLMLGGILIVAGLIAGRADWEVAGLMFHSGAVLVQLVAVIAIFGWLAALVSLFIYGAIVAANIARAWILVRYQIRQVVE